MQRTLLTLLSVLFCAITFAQSVPQGINYQAVARDANGAVLMNQTLTIQFSVISDITTSAVSWQETHTVSTNDYGLYTAIIGQGTATNVGSSASFDVIDWGASNHLLKVEVDYGGGLIDMGTTVFMSVPYSIYSANPGPQGPQGLQGVPGVDGTNGIDGTNGLPGSDGTNGTNGIDGVDGNDGVNGNDGADGADGTNGIDGNDGVDGIDGLNGAVGATGPAGADGNDGTNGIDGTDGQGGITNAGTGISVTGAGTSVSPYVVSTSTCGLSIGDTAQGGIIFYLDPSGCHGLVCALTDQSSGIYQSIRWYAGSYGNTQAKGDGIYAGKTNTAIIIASQVAIGDDNSTYAARMCNELQITQGGVTYGDWYLPSKFELNEMYVNLHLQGFGGFANSYYWSSNETGSVNAWRQDFSSGFQFSVNKINYYDVRAVRAF